jgi:uncharacterized protein YdiU (UPF0061 family)
MAAQGADWTLTFRRLSDAARGDSAPVRLLFAEPGSVEGWLAAWGARRAREGAEGAGQMDEVNPLVIPRNHLVEQALAAAVGQGDLAPFEALLAAITDPFGPATGRERFTLPPPAGFAEGFRTFCGT